MGLAIAGGIVAILLAAGAYWLSHPKKNVSAGDLQLKLLAPDVYIYRGFFSNSAVLVLDGGVVVIDTQVSPRAAARLKREIEKVTDKPVTHVVNTHYHGDHTGGNAVFEGAEIIGSEQTVRYCEERDSERTEYAETFGLEFVEFHETVPPTRTFSGKLVVQVGADAIECLQIGRSETPDASIVVWPARGVVACGDGVATVDYPYLGVPFMDEGLRDDGQWTGYLTTIADLQPALLIPGHGPALIGPAAVKARIDLLVQLMTDLLSSVKAELEKGTDYPTLVDRVDRKLAHYRQRPDLREHTVSQRFAIYRCLNNLLPDRNGAGWWHEFRPSVVVRAPPESVDADLDGADAARVHARVRQLITDKRGPVAHALLDRWLDAHPDDAQAWAMLSDYCFEAALPIKPTVDATEYIALATKAAKKAVALDDTCTLGLLNLGAASVFGGVVLAQPMDAAIALLEKATARGLTRRSQVLRAQFFLGRAHQAEERDADADHHYRRMLPVPVRPLYPLVRERIRSLL